MLDIIRDSPLGQATPFLTRKRLGGIYPEESPDFKIPAEYDVPRAKPESADMSDVEIDNDRHEKGPKQPGRDVEASPDSSYETTESPQSERKTAIVTWYSESDPANPHNWSTAKKAWVSTIILLYTFSVYIGSSLYTASIIDVMRIFDVGETVASLGLAVYVLGYGVGPMLFAPLSEIPAIGRAPPFIWTYIVFVVLCVPTALVDNFAGLIVLRFLLGFFGSPCLGSGGACYGDFLSFEQLPYAITVWGAATTLGPGLGPLVAGFAVSAENWRWSSWELLWLSGPLVILMFISLPETSTDTILLKRAKRLRALTGRTDLKSESEIRQSEMTAKQVTFDALIKPWEINILDPAVLFTTIYSALMYGMYYSFFESFPLVYPPDYGFNLGEQGLAFLAVLIGLLSAAAIYSLYLHLVASPRFRKAPPGSIPPEVLLTPGLYATYLIPAGLFLFAWTARPSIPWIVSLIGVAIASSGIFPVFQAMFIYLASIYPRYAGSLFAANDFARSAFAAGAVLFARPMFLKLGVDGGVSLIAGLTVLCVFGFYALYFFGAALRGRSRFAGAR